MSMTRLLFVCMGNICRSPAAEGVMKHLVERENLGHRIECDSAGTIGYHSGELPDHRMRQTARERGIILESRARHIQSKDLETFDLILTMDQENLDYVRGLENASKYSAKIRPFCEFLTHHSNDEVPDPYYQGLQGFYFVLDLLEDGCEGILEEILKEREQEH